MKRYQQPKGARPKEKAAGKKRKQEDDVQWRPVTKEAVENGALAKCFRGAKGRVGSSC